MTEPSLLNLGNARKVKANLSAILDDTALNLIEKEIHANTLGLYALARHHFRFAVRQPPQFWRQRVSRLYYGAYNAARAVRLFKSGEYSTDAKDHQKFSQLPEDFPGRSRYSTELQVLREDRNLCDYDHLSIASSLALGTSESTILVREFLHDVESYLREQGVDL